MGSLGLVLGVECLCVYSVIQTAADHSAQGLVCCTQMWSAGGC